ncbi:unnamed protein product [Rhodiola kirilowii]
MTSMQSPTDTCLTFRHQSRRHHPRQSTPGLFLSLSTTHPIFNSSQKLDPTTSLAPQIHNSV